MKTENTAGRPSLIEHYDSMLRKVKALHGSGHKEGSHLWERGQEYVKYAEAELEAVKNGRPW